MFRLTAALTLAALIGGCAQLPLPDLLRPKGAETAASVAAEADAEAVDPGLPEPLPTAAAPVPPAQVAAAPAALDTVTEAEKDAARATAAASTGGVLGDVTVALGDPADPGLWVKSALVTSEQPGTVRTGGGDAIAVVLKPLGSGAGGPQISLAALRALGLPLTGLHPVTLAAGT